MKKLTQFFISQHFIMEKSCEKFLSLLFCMFCMLLTIFLCTLQLMKYFENNDSSSFKYREYFAEAQDQYPLFTFCYEKSEKQINGPNLLNSNYLDKRKLNRTELLNSLTGKESNSLDLRSTFQIHPFVFFNQFIVGFWFEFKRWFLAVK